MKKGHVLGKQRISSVNVIMGPTSVLIASRPTKELPIMGALAMALESVFGELLREVIGILEGALNTGHDEFSMDGVVIPKPVPLDVKVFGAVGQSVVGSQCM
jgi:hypothetical protein